MPKEETVTATSDWVEGSKGDARANCNKKLKSQGGDISGEIRYSDEKERKTSMGKTERQVSCSCFKDHT